MSNGSSGNGSGTPADMAFVEYALPPLESGEFTVTVTQAVSVQGQGATYSATQSFTVAGEQFTLGPTDVNSVYPPPGSQDDCSSVLPHVVLTSPTLPWERSPIPAPPPPVAGEPVPTWLAVLSFDENDPPPTPQALTVGNLTAPPAGIWCPPPVTQLASTTPLTAIDVPLTTFNAIAPSLADLGWTAHVRAVDPALKAAGPGAPPVVDYAVVFGNRLPVPGNTTTAYLVSLEGFGPYLPGGTAITAGWVRVVVLQSWTFTALDLQQDFAGLLTQVSLDPPVLSLPYDAGHATGDPWLDAAVADAFGMGYTAMDHTLRDGGSTVSWYRGPLLPLGTSVTAAPPWNDSDQLLRYDPLVGMFDVSYAAAWELGRLLALHDAAYAAALYRWKLTRTQAAAAALEAEIIDAQLPRAVQAALGSGTETDARHARLAAVIKGVVGPAAVRLRHAPHAAASHAARQPRRRLTREALRARLAGEDAPHPINTGPGHPAPQTGTDQEQVTQWLTLLYLLNGVPFNYLVPDIAMLPAESMRFFQVDGNWIEALLDGAFSIGSAAAAHSTGHHRRHSFFAAAAARARSGVPRRELLARARRRTSFTPPPAPDPPPDAPEVLSGFLLRSAVVAGWPGMEVTGFAADQAPLQIVRMETVAPSLLLCIFAGVVASVELREPGETVHFGLTANGASWQQELRYANGSQVGEFIPGAAGTLPVALRGSGTPAIVPMDTLAQSMSTLVWDGTPPEGTTFTAAQFGLEMVQGAQKVTFLVTPT